MSDHTLLHDLLRGFRWRHYIMVWAALMLPPLIYWVGPWAETQAPIRPVVVALVFTTCIWSIWCFMAFAFAWYLPLTRRHWVRTVVAYSVFVYVVMVSHGVIASWAHHALRMDEGVAITMVVPRQPYSLIILANMVFAGNAIAFATRANRREKAIEALQRELADVQLAELKVTLDPADTFETVARIRQVLRADPAKAIEEIVLFGDRLRARMILMEEQFPSSGQ